VLVLSHNVTPARWMWDVDALTAVRCDLGLRQLHRFARAADLAAGVSAYNAEELRAAGARAVDVVPIVLDPGRLGAPAAPRPPARHGGHVLSVGRLAPHKRPDALIRAVAHLRRRGRDTRLTLVGEPVNEDFGDRLRALAGELAPDTVSFARGLSSDELAEAYRRADAFLLLSEHEGFCVPLLEAFHFGVPVVARAASAVPETAGDAAVLLAPADGPAVTAEALALVLDDGDLRDELRARGRRRLAAYAPEAAAARLRAVVERAGARLT
jgi:glycosyltransferase involved in cell wall biosynthesis